MKMIVIVTPTKWAIDPLLFLCFKSIKTKKQEYHFLQIFY